MGNAVGGFVSGCVVTVLRPAAVSAALGLFLLARLAPAAPLLTPADLPEDVTQLSLEDLLKVQITSVAKVPQKATHAAAAVFVLRRDDIRRSGATCIPELLRMVPGLEVARIDANKWAITSRAPNSRFANKLLVLMDGRSVYTPLHGGVYWDQQDTLLADIERIEVFRGPNAALWGANASTGVINIITRSAKDTQGGLAMAAAGNEVRAMAGVRWGDKLTEDGKSHYRVWAKHNDRDDLVRANGAPGADEWNVSRGGFRIDLEESKKDSYTFLGNLYDGRGDQAFAAPSLTPPIGSRIADAEIFFTGANLLGRWRRVESARSDMTLQVWFDRTDRTESLLGERRDTYDVEFQMRREINDEHELLGGIEYRLTTDRFREPAYVSLNPRYRDDPLYSAFAQDRIRLDGDKLVLTVGARVENNNYTGTQLHPNVRLAWIPEEDEVVWGAISRATRTPSRLESDIRLDAQAAPGVPLPVLSSIFGSKSLVSETVTAYELGYRFRPADKLFVGLSTFYNVFHDILGFAVGTPFLEATPAPLHLQVPFVLNNQERGHSKGAELTAEYEVSKRWRLAGGYGLLELDGFSATAGAGSIPEQQVSLRSYLDLSSRLDLDTFVYFVDDLTGSKVPSYARLDLRLGYRPTERLELDLVGQNLLDDRHPEFGSNAGLFGRSEIERSVYAKATWKF